MNAHPSWNIEEKVEELLESPAGCAFLVVLNESGVSAVDAVRPEISFQAACLAVEELNIWSPDFAEVMKYALMNGRRLRDLARGILEQPDVGWWFAPIDREAQMWIGSRGEPPSSDELAQPNVQMTHWEQRTNKSEAGMYTCTSFEGETSFLTVMDISDVHGPANDMAIHFEFPLRQWRLRVSESARVYEINGAADWYRLCADYPAKSARDASDPEPSDDEGWAVYPLTFGCPMKPATVNLRRTWIDG